MSSELRRGRTTLESTCNAVVNRIVKIPRNLIGGFSRAMNQGIDLINIGSRRNQNHHNHSQNFHSQPPLNFPFQDPSNFPPMIQEEWAFLARFEQQFGTEHPFFYVCRFMDVLKIAQDEHKFLFVYIHEPEHPFVPSFCRDTLCSELVVQFLDANFVCWGALCNRGEGLHLCTALRVSSFPFCAVVAPAAAAADNLAVLQQIEGPVSPAELVEHLQRTLEEQGLAFGSGRARLEEKRRADHRLREEQDAAYLAALKIDQEKEMVQKKSSSEDRVAKTLNIDQEKEMVQKKSSSEARVAKTANLSSISAESSQKTSSNAAKKGEVTQILIRFPNGERREQSFKCTDKIEAIYRYIDSLCLAGDIGNYRLISNFPRKVYGVDQMGMSLKDSGFHPKASLFLEIL